MAITTRSDVNLPQKYKDDDGVSEQYILHFRMIFLRIFEIVLLRIHENQDPVLLAYVICSYVPRKMQNVLISIRTRFNRPPLVRFNLFRRCLIGAFLPRLIVSAAVGVVWSNDMIGQCRDHLVSLRRNNPRVLL